MAERVTDYSVIESDSYRDLVEAVCKALGDHWQPQGGLVIWYEPGNDRLDEIVHYAQALVKHG